jgi:hypothetical protein
MTPLWTLFLSTCKDPWAGKLPCCCAWWSLWLAVVPPYDSQFLQLVNARPLMSGLCSMLYAYAASWSWTMYFTQASRLAP